MQISTLNWSFIKLKYCKTLVTHCLKHLIRFFCAKLKNVLPTRLFSTLKVLLCVKINMWINHGLIECIWDLLFGLNLQSWPWPLILWRPHPSLVQVKAAIASTNISSGLRDSVSCTPRWQTVLPTLAISWCGNLVSKELWKYLSYHDFFI